MNVRVIFFNELRFLRVLIISTFLKKSFFFYSAPPNVEFTFNFQSKFRNGARVLNIRFHNRIIINTSVIRETVILMPVRIQRNSKKKKKKNSSSFERNSRRKLRREISMRFKGSHFSGSFSQLEEIKWPKRERDWKRFPVTCTRLRNSASKSRFAVCGLFVFILRPTWLRRNYDEYYAPFFFRNFRSGCGNCRYFRWISLLFDYFLVAVSGRVSIPPPPRVN